LSIPIIGENIIGKNLIHITVDSKDLIAELPVAEAENNNELRNSSGQKGYPFYVLDNSAVPTQPKEFSIAAKAPVTLRAYTYNATGEKNDFIIQIDTTEAFNSSLFQSYTVSGASGLVSWEPQLNYLNGEVYYWRISPDSTNAEVGFVWKNSSFTFIEDSPNGWSQSDYYQFLKDDFNNLQLKPDGDFNFATNLNDYFIRNKVWESGNPPAVFVNGAWCKDCLWFPYSPTIVVVMLDQDGQYILQPGVPFLQKSNQE